MYEGKQFISLLEYLKAPGISKHDLDDLNKSPAYYNQKVAGHHYSEPAQHQNIGTAIHSLFFEDKVCWEVRPDTYTNDKGETKPWNANAKACKSWMEGRGMVLKSADDDYVRRCVGDMRNEPAVRYLMAAGGEYEVSLFAIDPEFGLLLKTRPDYMTADGVYIDLKTTTDASTDAFSRTIFKYRYHVQAAMVRRVARLMGLPFERYYYIAMEKTDPVQVNVRELKCTALDLGEFAIEDGLRTLRDCMDSGDWPGYSGTDAKPDEIDLPPYAYVQEEMDSGPLIIGGKEVAV